MSMDAVDEMIICDALGTACRFSESRDWLIDHRFEIYHEENSGSYRFQRDFSFNEGQFFFTVYVEFNIEDGMCRAYMSGIGGTVFYELHENGCGDKITNCIEMKYDEYGAVYDEGFEGEFAGDIVKKCLCKAIRIHEKSVEILKSIRRAQQWRSFQER